MSERRPQSGGRDPAASPAGALDAALQAIGEGRSLERAQARRAMDALLRGEATPAQIGAFLMGLRVKGETAEEVAGFVEAMRDACVKVSAPEGAVDLCGTGGDGSGTFNISTAASLVVAAAGVPVAKHGNRSASSRCGSADVLEELGVPIRMGPEEAASALEEHRFAFLFAPDYHPAMRHVAGARRELRLRTVFNILGPLASPAGVRRQLVGVFSDGLRGLVAGVLARLGTEYAWIVHGAGGLDEVSVCGPTRVTVVSAGRTREIEIVPEDAGLPRSTLGGLRGGGRAENARMIEAVLSGARGPQRDAVVLNAAAALVVAGRTRDLREGAELAEDVLAGGAAAELLARLRNLR